MWPCCSCTHAQHVLCKDLGEKRAPAPSLPLVSLVHGALPLALGSMPNRAWHTGLVCVHARHAHSLCPASNMLQAFASSGRCQSACSGALHLECLTAGCTDGPRRIASPARLMRVWVLNHDFQACSYKDRFGTLRATWAAYIARHLGSHQRCGLALGAASHDIPDKPTGEASTHSDFAMATLPRCSMHSMQAALSGSASQCCFKLLTRFGHHSRLRGARCLHGWGPAALGAFLNGSVNSWP